MFEIGELVQMIADDESNYTVIAIRSEGKYYDIKRNSDDLVFEYVSGDHLVSLK